MTLRQTLSDARWSDGRRESIGLLIGLTTFGMLVLELALIRWTSSQVRVFAYFNNIVLICAFLGIGLGVALGPRRPGLIHLVLPLALILSVPLALSEPLGLVYLPFPDNSIVLWGGQELPGSFAIFARSMAVFLGLLVLIVGIFVGCGAALGFLFGRLNTLRAYQADLIGSLLGVLAFTTVTGRSYICDRAPSPGVTRRS